MAKLKIAVIFGGRGEEHPVSVKSAREIAKNLDGEKYEPFYIGITKTGAWKLCEGPGADWEKGPPVILPPDGEVHGLIAGEPGRRETIRLDMAFPVLHGRTGEDGAIQGLLELSGIPYAGCDIQSSALCMDKSLAYTVAAGAGIATPNFITLAPDLSPDLAADAVDAGGLSYPVFVKPARSGSSFGVGKVRRKEELAGAVEAAGVYDAKVLIEEAVAGREVGCAILGNGADLFTGEVDQIRLSRGFFRIHQESSPEKGSENSTVIVPAGISAEERQLVLETAKTVYRALGCGGLSRVDLFLGEDEKNNSKVILNEVNTMPGMTSYSRYPRMMAAAGLSLAGLIDRIVSLTLDSKI
jgi:D-alanine--(R)-lactate ligase